MVDLLEEKNYWVHQVEYITAFKKGFILDMPSVQVDDNLDTKLEWSLDKGLPNGRVVSTSSTSKTSMHYLPRLAQATQAIIDVFGSPPHFDLTREFS